MKRGLLLTMAMLAVIFATFSFFIPGNSSALLTADAQFVRDDMGTATVADDMYWVRDLSLFTNKTYVEQLATISDLSIPGYSGFGLADGYGIETLFAHGGETLFSLFPPTVINSSSSLIQGRTGVIGQYPVAGHYLARVRWDGGSYEVNHLLASIDDNYSSAGVSAWVVGYNTPVPIPGAVWLFGSGLIGLVGIGRKRFKK